MSVAVEIDEVPRQIDVVRFDAAVAGNADEPAPVMAEQPAFLATSMSDVELERSVVVDIYKRETPAFQLPAAGFRPFFIRTAAHGIAQPERAGDVHETLAFASCR